MSNNETFTWAMKKIFETLPKYQLELGVFASDTKRTQLVGVTNAELMFIHENGSPARNIPARPVLQMTIDWANKNILHKSIYSALLAYSKSWNITDYENELEKMCVRIQQYARNIIRSNDGRLVENSPKTIKKKGDNHPLFDTGQLMKSITCRLVKVRE